MGPYILLIMMILSFWAGKSVLHDFLYNKKTNEEPEPPKQSKFEKKLKASAQKSREKAREDLQQLREKLAREKAERERQKEEEKRRKKEEKQAKHK